jgi:uncharacterized protein (DUF983 family)
MPDNQELVTGITGPAQASEVPQFSTAEYAHIPGTERCGFCGNAISGEYYRVNRKMACSKCGADAKSGQPTDSHTAFLGGLLWGIGGAVLGLVLYSAVIITVHMSIGYLGLAVGWLVGTAVIKGSNGIGGRRYQVVAVILTYLAISLSSVPLILSTVLHSPQLATHRINWVAVVPVLVKWGLASPFLKFRNPFNGIMGLLILFVGLSIAARLTAAKPLAVDGPFPVTG